MFKSAKSSVSASATLPFAVQVTFIVSGGSNHRQGVFRRQSPLPHTHCSMCHTVFESPCKGEATTSALQYWESVPLCSLRYVTALVGLGGGKAL